MAEHADISEIVTGLPEPRTKGEAEHPWIGVVFQYRKVGTFRLLAPLRSGNGWWACQPVKAPKRYREQAATNGGWLPLCPDPRAVIVSAPLSTSRTGEVDHG